MARRLGKTHGPGDRGREDEGAEVPAELGLDLGGEPVRPSAIVNRIPATESCGLSCALTRLIVLMSCDSPSSA